MFDVKGWIVRKINKHIKGNWTLCICLIIITAFCLLSPRWQTPYSGSDRAVYSVHARLIFLNATNGLRIISNFTVEIRGPETRSLMEKLNATNGIAISSYCYYIEEQSRGYPPSYLIPQTFIGQPLLICALGKERAVRLPSYQPNSDVVDVLVVI